jgi:hypothetical protein
MINKIEIETEKDYQEAVIRFIELCQEPNDTADIKEMYLLMDLMGKYERENCAVN